MELCVGRMYHRNVTCDIVVQFHAETIFGKRYGNGVKRMKEIKSEKVRQLLEAYRNRKTVLKTEKLFFCGECVRGKDVYNVSKEFEVGGEKYIFGRVETRDSELSETVLFRREKDGHYHAMPVKIEMLQDPCVSYVGEIVLCGTKVCANESGNIESWRTAFYKHALTSPELFLQSPLKMKDARVFAYKNGVLVFSRPQGERGGKGTVGFVRANSLDDVTEDMITSAPLLDGMFDEESWGGVNDVTELENGKIGIVGHIASMEEDDIRHYYGMTFILDPQTSDWSDLKIICERKDFAAGAYKRKDLIDVVFMGGLVRNGDGTAVIYTGLSDAEAHKALIKDPFSEVV